MWKHGAVEVFIGDRDEDEAFMGAGHLVVVLPVEVDRRLRLLGLLDDLAEEQGFDSAGDFGRTMQFVTLD